MPCDSCEKKSAGGGVSEAAFEFACHKFSTIIRWLCVVILILALGHIAWAVAWTQYDYTSEEVSVEALDGVANYIGESGDIINGANSSPQALP